jgi:hypothetical protein
MGVIILDAGARLRIPQGVEEPIHLAICEFSLVAARHMPFLEELATLRPTPAICGAIGPNGSEKDST